jgi:hypothetical protein
LSRQISAPRAARSDDARGRDAMTFEGTSLAGYSPRELVLAAAARAVLSAFREPLEERRLSPPATATLRLLETALEPYGDEPFGSAPPDSGGRRK